MMLEKPVGITSALSDDFKGPENLDRDTVHQIMTRLLMIEYRFIEVTLTPQPIPVQINPQDLRSAHVEFHARVRGKNTEESDWVELNPLAGGTRFKSTFTRTDKGWSMSELSIGR